MTKSINLFLAINAMVLFMMLSLMLLSPPASARMDLSACDHILNGRTLENANLRFPGKLCAIQPSKTGRGIEDFPSGQKGFGWHAIGIPNNLNSRTPVWIHFSGTYGRPFNPEVGDYATQLFLSEIVSKGYLVIQLAYANPLSVNHHYCAGPPGSLLDWCAYYARWEILDGIDGPSPANVNRANGAQNRLRRLLTYMENKGFPLPTEVRPQNLIWKNWEFWKKFHLSGHSQGAGHAYYIAKYVRVKSACGLGGPYDRPDMVNLNLNQPFADWMLQSYQATPVNKLGGLSVRNDDNHEQFVASYILFGLREDRDWFDAPGALYHDKNGKPIMRNGKPNGHAAAIGAVELADERAKACFQ